MRRVRIHRVGLSGLIVVLLVGVFFSQRALNRDRLILGITRGESLGKNAPPILVFTTVALGGFRGLIANALWVRSMDLQEQDKFFEKVQLADWITKLQPHFISVWLVQAWDMAYNISVKFSSPKDRWMWVKRGLELLRDQGLKYNPDEPMLYRELGWFFQHKIGMDLDDAHRYYKREWAKEMDEVLGTNYVNLINPQTDEEKARARRLREEYKMDPKLMQEIDEEYGPLEWRLPEAHAVYWATLGFRKSNTKDLIALRREIYQPLQLAFQRGHLTRVDTPQGPGIELGPNLAMIPRANKAYERMAEEDADYRQHILKAHRNFLKDAIYFLYTHNRKAEAEEWYRYLLTRYPDVEFADVRMEGKPIVHLKGLSLDDYAAARVSEDAAETSNTRTTSNLLGLLTTALFYLATDRDDEAAGHELLARAVWNRYQNNLGQSKDRIDLAPFDTLKRRAFDQFESTYLPELSARLRTKMGLPPRSIAATNSVPMAESLPAATNAVPAAAGAR